MDWEKVGRGDGMGDSPARVCVRNDEGDWVDIGDGVAIRLIRCTVEPVVIDAHTLSELRGMADCTWAQDALEEVVAEMEKTHGI